MQEIPFVWIDGGAEAGKTTLIERILESSRKREFAVLRCFADDMVTETESDDGDHEECKRYQAAGAIAQLRLRYPLRFLPGDESEAMEHVRCIAWHDWFGDEPACDALICEGQNDFDWRCQVRVFVARPLPDGESLITKERRELFRIDLGHYLGLLGIENAGPPPKVISAAELEGLEEVHDSDDVPEPVRQLMDMAKSGVPVSGEVWGIRPGYEKITKAAVIVINIHNENERLAASRLIGDIDRLRSDCDVAKGVSSFEDYRGKRSIYICNLSDPADKERVKALTRIKRPIQEFRPRYSGPVAI